MSRQRLTCYYTQGPSLIQDVKESKKIEVGVNEWKILNSDEIFSKNFLTCIAVVAVLAELQEGRVALYLYHAREQYNFIPFIQQMIKENVGVIHIFSKTADINSQHYIKVPELIKAFNDELKKQDKDTITLNRIEVPSYSQVLINLAEQKILLNKPKPISSTEQTDIIQEEILMNLPQIKEKLNQWSDTELAMDSDEDKAETNFFQAIASEIKARTNTNISSFKNRLADNILHHQAEDGGDKWPVRVYKSLARVLSCRVIIIRDGIPVIVDPEIKALETKPLQIKDNGNGQYEISKETLALGSYPETIIAATAAKDMTQEKFEKELTYKREVGTILTTSATTTLLYSHKEKEQRPVAKSARCCPLQCIVL